jgi:hypothetical protein
VANGNLFAGFIAEPDPDALHQTLRLIVANHWVKEDSPCGNQLFLVSRWLDAFICMLKML